MYRQDSLYTACCLPRINDASDQSVDILRFSNKKMSDVQNENEHVQIAVHLPAEHKWPLCMYDIVSDVVGIPYNFGQVYIYRYSRLFVV